MPTNHAAIGDLPGNFTDFTVLEEVKFFVAAKWYNDDRLVVEFAVYEILGFDTGTGQAVFPRQGSDCAEPCETAAESEVFLSGSVKWDGCSNWHFEEQDRNMLHFCSRQQAGDIGRLFEALQDRPGHDAAASRILAVRP